MAILNIHQIDSKKLFMLDGLGAVISALMLGVVLPNSNSWFGMPENILIMLALVACVLGCWSWSMYVAQPTPVKKYLQLTALFNLSYIVFTIIMIFKWQKELMILDWVYFITELVLVSALIVLEWHFKPSE